jgi:protein TonB
VRFKAPPPQAQRQKAVPEKKTRKIPIPDPTPDEPEPILVEADMVAPEIDVEALGDLIGIPEGPIGSGAGPGGPLWVEGNVKPPEKLYAPQPRYTEEARKARIQGVVILQAIVDALGNVTRVQVLKGLPQGLDTSAVDTVQTWKYKPATLEGEPVPVYLNLTISFSLQ